MLWTTLRALSGVNNHQGGGAHTAHVRTCRTWRTLMKGWARHGMGKAAFNLSEYAGPWDKGGGLHSRVELGASDEKPCAQT